jgi:hypothetical protein
LSEQMKEPGSIDIVKTRDTREISKLSFNYISKNAGSLLLPIVSISIPLAVISQISAIAISENYNAFNRLISLKKGLSPRSFLVIIVLFLVYIIGLSLHNYFINTCLIKSERKAKNEEPLVGESLVDQFKMHFLNFIILFAIFYLISNISQYFYTQFITDLEPDIFGGMIGYVWHLCVSKLPWFILLPPVFFFCFSASYLSLRDGIGSSDALTKIWSLVKTKPQKLWFNSIKVSGIYFGLILALKVFLWYLSVLGGFFEHYSPAFYHTLTILEIVFTLIALIHLHVSMLLLYGSFEDEEHGNFIKHKVETL